MENLGYELLNDKEKAAYKIIEDAVRKHSRSCDVTRVPHGVDLMHVLLAVLGDYPDVIYFNRTLLRTSSSLFSKQITFTGIVPPKQEKEREEKLAREKTTNNVQEFTRKPAACFQVIRPVLILCHFCSNLRKDRG